MSCSKALFPACAIDKNKNIYYVTHGEHIIKKWDLETGQIEYLDNPDEYCPRKWAGVDRLFLHSGKLYLLEQNGRRILQYSLHEKTRKCFELSSNLNINGNNWAATIVHKNTVFIVSSYANELIKINLVSNEIEKEKLELECDYILEREKGQYTVHGKEVEIIHRLYSCSCKVGSDMWIFTERRQTVLRYDLEMGKKEKFFLPDTIQGCSHAVCKNGIFYILSLEGNVYSWNFENNETKLLYDGEGKNPWPSFGGIVITEKKLWMLPCFAEDIYVIDLKNGEKDIYSIYPEDFQYLEDPNRSRYYAYCEDKENYYFAMHSANYMLIIEKKSDNVKWLQPTEPVLKKIVDYYVKYPMEQYSETDFGLDFLLMISGQSTLDKEDRKKVGKCIWEFCK